MIVLHTLKENKDLTINAAGNDEEHVNVHRYHPSIHRVIVDIIFSDLLPSWLVAISKLAKEESSPPNIKI